MRRVTAVLAMLLAIDASRRGTLRRQKKKPTIVHLCRVDVRIQRILPFTTNRPGILGDAMCFSYAGTVNLEGRLQPRFGELACRILRQGVFGPALPAQPRPLQQRHQLLDGNAQRRQGVAQQRRIWLDRLV